MSISTFEGFQYTAGPRNLSLSFKHRLQAKRGEDGSPAAEVTSLTMPYSELLDIASSKTIDAAEQLNASKVRYFDQVGVVATTLVDPKDAPPGVHNFLRYFWRPWSGEVDYFNPPGQVLASFYAFGGSGPGYAYYCLGFSATIFES